MQHEFNIFLLPNVNVFKLSTNYPYNHLLYIFMCVLSYPVMDEDDLTNLTVQIK